MRKECLLCLGLLLAFTEVIAQKVSANKKAQQGYEEAIQLYRGKNTGKP